MSLLQIAVNERTPRLFPENGPPDAAVASALEATDGPVTFMVHGYKYAPGHSDACPFHGLFGAQDPAKKKRIRPWPNHLGSDGLLIGLGWQARGTPQTAYRRAAEAAIALAALIKLIHRHAPKRDQHVLAHSLGARVALQAFHYVPKKALSSMILLAAAEYRGSAEAALGSKGAQDVDVLHVTSGENGFFDFLFERVIPSPQRGDRAIGARDVGHAQTLLLDSPDALQALADLGYPIAPPSRRVCHWSVYLRPGVFKLYRALIRGELSHRTLVRALKSTVRALPSH
ncbi:MAG: alpha/beta fold hydrolase [Marinovum sp.]|nr:alpha/beta fold hydrolase [Marinovum sp.]